MKVFVYFCITCFGAVFVGTPCVLNATIITINSRDFDTDQFDGATVNYRADGDVSFDGKTWDNAVGAGSFALGDLAAGQFGSDPGDQITLEDRSTPDWLQLNYANSGIEIGANLHQLVIHEITSASSGVDTEGLSFRVQFNGGSWHNASEGDATFFDAINTVSSGEDTNQIVFDLLDFGFNVGDFLQTVRIENLDTGSGTSDPDFIFMGLQTETSAVPEPSSFVLAGFSLVSALLLVRRKYRVSTVQA